MGAVVILANERLRVLFSARVINGVVPAMVLVLPLTMVSDDVALFVPAVALREPACRDVHGLGIITNAAHVGDARLI